MTSPDISTWHPRERILDVQNSGIWSQADIEPYFQEMAKAAATYASEGALLVDLTNYGVQDGPVADAMQSHLARLREAHSFRRVAVVLSPRATSQMQTRRIAASPTVDRSMFFSDRAAAWAAMAEPVNV